VSGLEYASTRRTILIVDDEPELVRALAVRLQSAGYDTLSADNGLRAQTTAHAEQPDLILLDIGLPLANGFEVLAGLRSRRDTARIPIVFLTARTWESERANALKPDGYLTKPYQPDTLLEVVGRLTGATSQPPTESASSSLILG
jgi:two-component system, OmpR family, KDP operon response regulator KdpE